MLGKNFLKIDDLFIPNPLGMTVSIENIEITKKSEAGTTLSNVTRLGIRTWSLSIQATSFWLDRYIEICKKDQAILTYRSEQIPVECRLNSYDLVENSANVANTDGLWNVGLDIKEI